MWPYWDGFCQRRPAVQMHASRGCPYKCTFCLWISVIYDQGRYRTFSPKRIVDEMEEIVCGKSAPAPSGDRGGQPVRSPAP